MVSPPNRGLIETTESYLYSKNIMSVAMCGNYCDPQMYSNIREKGLPRRF